MSTKKRTKKQKKTKLTNITKAIGRDDLRRALVRRARARKSSLIHDQAVPAHLCVSPRTDEQCPSVSASTAPSLSPFVIDLSRILPTPNEILEEDARINLNFLPLIDTRVLDAQPEEPQETLTLTPEDIASQIAQDLHWSPCPYKHTVSFSSIRTDRITKLNESIPKGIFVPKTPPENILSYFDLPETEEASADEEDVDESELIELDGAEFQLPELMTEKKWKWHFPTMQPWMRTVGAFVMISFVFVLPLHAMRVVGKLTDAKTKIETTSQSAFSLLQAGTQEAIAQDATNARISFFRATERFGQAAQTIEELGAGTSLLLSALPSRTIKTGKALLAAGEALSIAGHRMTEAVTEIEKAVDPTPVSHIRLLQAYLTSALPYLTEADTRLRAINDEDIPKREREVFLDVKQKLPPLIASLNTFEELSSLALTMLGAQESKRYLLIFQNNTEIRPTGGFMGSFAEVKIRNGILEHLSVPDGGTYDLQGVLRISRVGPQPLQLLKARWEFQDANWFADFPTSAQQILEFYQDAGGPSVDGVIAINATFVAELIGLLGPIEMAAYGRIIDQENFLFETQKIVEQEYDRTENKPKAFIGDLAPKLIERVLEGNGELFLAIADRLGEGLSQKDIQLFFTDETLERQIRAYGWGGAIVQSEKDYLMVVNANLGGGKTDGIIEEDVHMNVNIEKDGSIINTVTITRTHHGIEGALFTGVNNVNYVRLYVPKGSQLIDAKGFSIPDRRLFEIPDEGWVIDDEIAYQAASFSRHQESGTDVYEEQGKTVFGNWIQTAPGASSEISFTYRLPFSINDKPTGWMDRMKSAFGLNTVKPYALIVQKQSGVIDRQTTVSIHLPPSVESLWQSFEGTEAHLNNVTDGFVAMLLPYSL